MYIAGLKALLARTTIYLLSKAQIAALQQNEAATKVLAKYSDFANVFVFELEMKLSENTGINKHTIELKKGKQPSYWLIYSL